MSVRRRGQNHDLSENTNGTFLEREAAQEAKNDWSQKSRSEKLKLARAEQRRRKAGKRFLGLQWNAQLIFITLIGLASFIGLVYLLSHSSAKKIPIPVKTPGSGFRIREKKRNPLERINGKIMDDLPPPPRKAKLVVEEEEEYEVGEDEDYEESDEATNVEHQGTETEDDVPVITMDPEKGISMEDIQRQLGL